MGQAQKKDLSKYLSQDLKKAGGLRSLIAVKDKDGTQLDLFETGQLDDKKLDSISADRFPVTVSLAPGNGLSDMMEFIKQNKDRDVLGQFKTKDEKKYVTCRKQRSLFQTQVSKAGKIDAAWKDWIFVGKRINAKANSEMPDGALAPEDKLPTPDVPSDHAALMFSISISAP